MPPNKKSLSERDICTQYITPAIEQAGWDFATQVREEVHFTAGQILVKGKTVKRGKGKRADYILYYRPNLPIAVVEAKDNNHPLGGGMQQALAYATDDALYEHPYPEGARSYNKTKPIRIEEFEPEKKWWCKPDARGGFKGRKASEQAWKVSAEEIKQGGYNLDIKNPHDSDTGPGDPDQLLSNLETIRGESRQTLERLKGELAAALGGES